MGNGDLYGIRTPPAINQGLFVYGKNATSKFPVCGKEPRQYPKVNVQAPLSVDLAIEAYLELSQQVCLFETRVGKQSAVSLPDRLRHSTLHLIISVEHV